MYRVIVDGDADIPPELYDKVVYVPQYVIYDGVSYKATRELISEKLEDMLIPGKISTSMPSTGDFLEGLKKLDYPAIAIHVSSGISSAYKSLHAAAETIGVVDKLYIFDTLTAAAGIGNYVYAAYTLLEKGINASEVYKILLDMQRNGKVQTLGLVGDARFAAHGGRVSGLAAAAANALRFQVIVSPDEKGVLKVVYKAFGRKKALRYVVKWAKELIEKYERPVVGISHAWCEKDARFVLEELLKTGKIAYHFMTYVNPTLVAHGGKGTISVSVMDFNY